MRTALSLLAAVAVAVAPASANEHTLLHGQVATDAAYVGCVRTATGPHYCFVAERYVDAAGVTGVRMLVKTIGEQATVSRLTLPATAMRLGTAGLRSTVRLVFTLPETGLVDVTHTAEVAMTDLVVNDGCVPLPVHLELHSSRRVLSLVASSTGTVAEVPVTTFDRCAAAVAVGPVSGFWRMTVA